MAAAFGALDRRHDFTQLVALHPERDAGVGIAAAFGSPIYVQLGKYAVEQYRFGTRGRNVGVAAVETRFPCPGRAGGGRRSSERQHRRCTRVVGLVGRQHCLLRHPAAPAGLGGMQNLFKNKPKQAGFGEALLSGGHPPLAEQNRRCGYASGNCVRCFLENHLKRRAQMGSHAGNRMARRHMVYGQIGAGMAG